MVRFIFMTQQIHIGTMAAKSHKGQVTSIWCSDVDGKYWASNWYRRTPRQLKLEAESALRDLRKEYPKLFKSNSNNDS